VAVAYKIDGEELSSYPADLRLLDQVEVIYKEFQGWKKPTTNARTYYDLPAKARAYVEVRGGKNTLRRLLTYFCQFIEAFVGVKVCAWMVLSFVVILPPTSFLSVRCLIHRIVRVPWRTNEI
jgi:hypothetical protein